MQLACQAKRAKPGQDCLNFIEQPSDIGVFLLYSAQILSAHRNKEREYDTDQIDR
jgi:hypothetical protein